MMAFNDLKDVKIVDDLEQDNWSWRDHINISNIRNHTQGQGVKIAIIDTGIDMNHLEFDGNIVKTLNAYNKTKNVDDDYGHGTHVASLIGGKNLGIAPKSELYIAKVLDKDGFGKIVNILDGITFAIHNKVDIIVMSLGMNSELPQILRDRILKAHSKGIKIISATGNSNYQYPEYPAYYDYIIGVGGVNEDLERASFSNYGWKMDVVAPSVDILGAYRDNKYAYMTGTSVASPIVAGCLALIVSYWRGKGLEISHNDIGRMFEKMNDRKLKEYGYGVIDVDKMMSNEVF